MIEEAEKADERRHALLALLDWYRAAGCDAAVSETPVDWRARAGTPPQSAASLVTNQSPGMAPAPAPPAPNKPRTGAPRENREDAPTAQQSKAPEPRPQSATRAFAPPPPDAAAQDAREAAASAATLAELRDRLDAFEGCGLKATAKNLCFYRGVETARLLIIGEAPGRDEDLQGVPFVGRAGQLLDRMLAAIGLDETHVHITNVVYWRPPGNRTPTPQEVHVCRPFLERQIELVAPDIIMTLGGPAAKAMLDLPGGIMKIRGTWRDATIGKHQYRLMPTLHPAYLLRTPAAKRLAWRDLLAVKAAHEARTSP